MPLRTRVETTRGRTTPPAPRHRRPTRVTAKPGEFHSGPGESEREELARLRWQKAEMARRHAEERAAWEAERAQLEMEPDVLKRSVVLWVKEAEGR